MFVSFVHVYIFATKCNRTFRSECVFKAPSINCSFIKRLLKHSLSNGIFPLFLSISLYFFISLTSKRKYSHLMWAHSLFRHSKFGFLNRIIILTAAISLTAFAVHPRICTRSKSFAYALKKNLHLK